MTTTTTNDHIRATLSDHAKLMVAVDTLADDADLYDAGLTSMSTVTVMLALEDSFDVEFPESMLSRATFSSISSIEAALQSHVPPAK
jgi:acyl carrier protein